MIFIGKFACTYLMNVKKMTRWLNLKNIQVLIMKVVAYCENIVLGLRGRSVYDFYHANISFPPPFSCTLV